MKRFYAIIIIVLCLVLTGILVGCNNNSEPLAEPTSSLTYELNDGEYTVTGVTENVENIVIPSEYEGLPVTSISESAFAYSRHTESILSVTIPDSVTRIERNAFYNRDEMTSVIIGQNSNLKTIGNNAFSGNHSLKSIYIPAGVTEIGDGAFNNDGAIDFTVAQANAVYRSENGHLIERATNTLMRGGQSGIVPNGISVIAQAAFRNATAIEELTIPQSVKSIGNYFIADSSITSVRYNGTEEQWKAIEKNNTMWNYGNRDVELTFRTESNVLIAYFSWSGTTTRLAQHIKNHIPNATLFQIERETPYSDDYNTVAYGEAKDEADNNARPPIRNPLSVEEMEQFDIIILAYPIWWHTAPMTVGTFLEKCGYDFNGVDIYPITQSTSMNTSQFAQSFEFVKTCAKGANVYDGLGTKSTDAIDAYLRANGIIE